MRGYCASVESNDCEAPAGFMMAAGFAPMPQQTGLIECAYCGEPVCRACSDVLDGQRVCNHHQAEELLFWLGNVEDVNV